MPHSERFQNLIMETKAPSCEMLTEFTNLQHCKSLSSGYFAVLPLDPSVSEKDIRIEVFNERWTGSGKPIFVSKRRYRRLRGKRHDGTMTTSWPGVILTTGPENNITISTHSIYSYRGKRWLWTTSDDVIKEGVQDAFTYC